MNPGRLPRRELSLKLAIALNRTMAAHFADRAADPDEMLLAFELVMTWHVRPIEPRKRQILVEEVACRLIEQPYEPSAATGRMPA